MSPTNRGAHSPSTLAVVLLCAASGCGRSTIFLEDGEPDDSSFVLGNSGGAASNSKAVPVAKTSDAVGGTSTVRATDGGSGSVRSSTSSPSTSTGSWNVGGLAGATRRNASTAGHAGAFLGSAHAGTAHSGGTTSAGGATSRRRTTNPGGTTSVGGRSSGGSSFGAGGSNTTGGASPCQPTRSATAGAAGFAGADVWYVDAQRGSDNAPGTFSQPLKTLSCASIAARSSDTVRLLDGTWDGSVEDGLSSRYDSACGSGSGIAFAPNVVLSAYNVGASRIISSGRHGICMRGGRIEGIRFECATGYPALETADGTLEIIGSSLKGCGTYGLNVTGTAQVSLRPGTLSNYSEDSNPYFAAVHDQGRLVIDGGKISYEAFAIQASDSATLELRGVTLSAYSAGSTTAGGVLIDAGAPQIVIGAGTIIDSASQAIVGNSTGLSLTINDLTVINSSIGIMISDSGMGAPSKFDIKKLEILNAESLGIDVYGRFDLTLKDTNFVGCGAPNLLLSGEGSANIENVKFDGGWGAMMFTGNESSSGLAVKVRNTVATGANNAAVYVTASQGDVFDFGTASSPGNNTFSGNSLSSDGPGANFVFGGPSGMTIQAVGNTWDANQQGADAKGRYTVAQTGVPLDVKTGTGPNYTAASDNQCTLRLAE